MEVIEPFSRVQESWKIFFYSPCIKYNLYKHHQQGKTLNSQIRELFHLLHHTISPSSLSSQKREYWNPSFKNECWHSSHRFRNLSLKSCTFHFSKVIRPLSSARVFQAQTQKFWLFELRLVLHPHPLRWLIFFSLPVISWHTLCCIFITNICCWMLVITGSWATGAEFNVPLIIFQVLLLLFYQCLHTGLQDHDNSGTLQ